MCGAFASCAIVRLGVVGTAYVQCGLFITSVDAAHLMSELSIYSGGIQGGMLTESKFENSYLFLSCGSS